MSISSRIEGTIENWRVKWGKALGDFLGAVISAGSLKLFEALEKEGKPYAQDYIDRFPIPPEMKGELQNFLNQSSPIHLAAIAPMAIGVVIGSLIGTFMGWATPISNWTRYVGDKIIKSFRFDPTSTITAWRRDPEKYEKFFGDLKDVGWDDERIEALKFITLFLPTADEQTHWLAREVYEPDMVAKYGLDDELPNYEETDFSKVGVNPEQMRNKWRAHWEHASWMQVVEMLHRGLLPEADVWEWFRVVEIPPYWRQLLIDSAYTWPTRVDVRRWWDMRTIDEVELRRLYSGMGYRGVNLDNYILWTKVYVAFPDLIARFKNGWITEDDVRSELIALGMPSARVDEMIQTKIKTAAPERVDPERTATATEIMKAAKKAYISWSEGVERLSRMGYSAEEADFKLTVYIGVEAGSPDTYAEFLEMTEKYRKAIGLDAYLPSKDLIEAGKAMKAARTALSDAESQNKPPIRVTEYLATFKAAEYRYRQLLISYEEEKKKAK